MFALFEDDGDLKVGTLISESDTTAHIETLGGRRLKVKIPSVLLRFSTPAEHLLTEAKAKADAIDLSLLWESLSDADLTFVAIAKEYFGEPATVLEQATTLVQLLANPMYFRKRGKGLFKRAPEAELKAALAGVERRKQEELQLRVWADTLIAGHWPEAFGPIPSAAIDRMLYAPDKNAAMTKAITLACETTKSSPTALLRSCGAIPSSHDFHFRRFLFHTFPKGYAFPSGLMPSSIPELPLAPVQAFSIDDAETTEIDDALSVSVDAHGITTVGIHIAAPALGIAPGSALDALARDRLSTVYMPGNKITMLPDDIVAQFTLAQGHIVPALSLYATLNTDLSVQSVRTVLERVSIAANLRLQTLGEAFLDDLATTRGPWHDALATLHRFAKMLFQQRGKNENNRTDYNFYITPAPDAPHDMEQASIRIETRPRGSAIDLIVSELMIFTNSTWGKWLKDHDMAGMFRIQGAGKTRMSTNPGAHEGLGVPVYLWSTSPIRRYSDLLNQRQLIALATEAAPAYTRNDAALLSAVADFDATYNQYGDFQQQMENYWCLRWLTQEGLSELTATVIRENLVRFERLPIVRRIDDLPNSAPGTVVRLRINAINFFEATMSLSLIASVPN
jgi:exoribonuclease II